jgi:hypothetical protein
VAYRELRYIVDNLQERASEQELSIKMINGALFKILEKKSTKFEEFKKDIKLRWQAFVEKNHDRIIKKTFTLFFYENFHELLSYFLSTFFDFDENSLKLFSKEKISDKIIFFEYNYLLNPNEVEGFTRISDEFQVEMLYGFSLLTGYLYYIVRLLGLIVRKVIQKNLFFLLDAVTVQDGAANKNLKFMIIIKDSKDEIFNSYYNMVLYYFLRQIKGIPEEYYENLLKGREKLYQIALNEYSSAKERLVDLLYYFYKKCNLLQSFSPLLDFFNFVGARVGTS